jgi:hypothetical protein
VYNNTIMTEIPSPQEPLPETQDAFNIEDGTELDATPTEIGRLFKEALQAEPKVMAVRRYLPGDGYVGTMQEVMPVIVARRQLHDRSITPLRVDYPNCLGEDTFPMSGIELLRAGLYQATSFAEISDLIPLITHEDLPTYIKNVNDKYVFTGSYNTLYEGFRGLDDVRSVSSILTHLRMSVANAAVNTMARRIPEIGSAAEEEFITWLNATQEALPVVDKVEQRCKQIIRDRGPEDALVAIRVIRNIEEGGLSTLETAKHPILTNPRFLASYPEVAVLLQARLVKEKAVARDSKQEQAYRMVARDLIFHLLNRYQSDPKRYHENVQKVQTFIFPDPKRPNTMVRERLIALANHASQSSGVGPHKYGSDGNGVVAPAFGEVLTITRSGTKAEQDSQAYEDKLYVNVIGMLLEQRKPETE